MSDLTTGQVNELFYQKVASGNPADMEKAAAAAEEYTRTKLREDGYMRKILPPEPITNEDLDRMVDNDRNHVVCDKELIECGSAMTVPYGTRPAMEYINTDRYAVTIARTQTKKYYKDISTFRTDRADVRQILSNNMVKDLLAEEDNKFTAVVNAIVGKAESYSAGSNVNNFSTQQHYKLTTASPWTDRVVFNDALNILPRLESCLPATTVLVNTIMVNDLQKWGMDDVGSDLAGDILINGWAERKLLNKRLIVTIKRNLVDDDEIYTFAEPKFMGHFFTIQDATVHMEREDGYIVKFFAYKEDGAAIGNTLSVGKATVTLSSND